MAASLELQRAPWEAHFDVVSTAGLRSIALRTPALTLSAVKLAFSASKPDATLIAIGGMLGGALTSVGLIASQRAFAVLFGQGAAVERLGSAWPALLILSLSAVGRSATLQVTALCQTRLRALVSALLEADLVRTTTSAPLHAFDDVGFMNALARARDGGVMSAPALLDQAALAWAQLATLAAAIITATALDMWLLPLLLVGVLPCAWASFRIGAQRYSGMFVLANMRRRRLLLSQLMDDRPPAAELRAHGMRAFLLDEFGRVLSGWRDAELEIARAQAKTRLAGQVAAGTCLLAQYATLGALVAAGEMPMSTAGAAFLALKAAGFAVTSGVQAFSQCYEKALYFADYERFQRVANSLGRRPTPRATRVRVRHQVPAAVESFGLVNASFSYANSTRPAVKGVTISVLRGELVALVGVNGSGKTTVAKLLVGLYEPTRGRSLRIGPDGATPIALADKSRLALVAQNPIRWPLTVAQNVALASSGTIDEGRVLRALSRVNLEGLASELPRGLDTLLDPRFSEGVDLSGGQWQRLAVARALYKEADLLVCDEPSSALDARNEQLLLRALRAESESRAVVLITHRLANAAVADRIYLLEAGRVIGEGTHEQLLLESAPYRDMFQLQRTQRRRASGRV